MKIYGVEGRVADFAIVDVDVWNNGGVVREEVRVVGENGLADFRGKVGEGGRVDDRRRGGAGHGRWMISRSSVPEDCG